MIAPAGSFVSVRYPWRAAIDASSPAPADYYASLIGQALRYGMPAARRGGVVVGAAAGLPFPHRMLATLLRRLPRHARPDLDEAVAAASSLGIEAGSLLALERSAGLTVFTFTRDGALTAVLKRPRGHSPGVEREAAALAALAGMGLAPEPLGTRGGFSAQRALSGAPVPPAALTLRRAALAPFPPEDGEVSDALIRMAELTAVDRRPEELEDGVIDGALRDGVPVSCRQTVERALAAASTMRRAVLKHGDISPQNCLFEGKRLCGFVDWETSRLHGAPGFDAWNACVSRLEHGLARRRWSANASAEAFARAWPASPLVTSWRGSARRAAAAAGCGDPAIQDALEVLFFARRLAQRLGTPSAPAAASHLEVVCGR